MKEEIVEERESKLFIVNISSHLDGNVVNMLAMYM